MENREFAWDDEISNDSEYTLLEEGDCDFEITVFERGRSKGSDKIPPCNMAILTIRLTDDKQNSTTVTDYLVLHSSMEWKLCQFFCAIGQRKHGETLRMNWNKVIGSKGRCKVKVDKYINDKGEERKSNKIDKYYEYQSSNISQASKKFTAGDF